MQVINHSRRHVLEPDREEIQAIPKEFSIDGQRGITRPIGMSGGRLEVTTMLVTSHATQIQNIERAASGAGIRISHFVQKGLASGLGVLSESQIESGAAVVDIGAGGTEVAVFSKGSMCFAAAIPVGGLLVTSDIGKLLKTSPEEAERLKLKAGKALAGSVTESESVGVLQLGQIHERPLQRRVLCEIIESRMREVATMVRQQLERSGHYGMLPGGVVLTGGGAQLLGVDDLFADVLQHHKVSIATPHVGGKSAPAVDSADMSTAIGMAKFVLTSESEELSTVGGDESLAGRIKTIWSLLSGKP